MISIIIWSFLYILILQLMFARYFHFQKLGFLIIYWIQYMQYFYAGVFAIPIYLDTPSNRFARLIPSIYSHIFKSSLFSNILKE
jgi:hypothetical protein